MSIEWDEIYKKWLLELPCPYEKSDLIQAFNIVENIYGKDFFQLYNSLRGQYIAKLVFDLSTILNEEEKGKKILPRYGEVNNTIEHNARACVPRLRAKLMTLHLESDTSVRSKILHELPHIR